MKSNVNEPGQTVVKTNVNESGQTVLSNAITSGGIITPKICNKFHVNETAGFNLLNLRFGGLSVM